MIRRIACVAGMSFVIVITMKAVAPFRKEPARRARQSSVQAGERWLVDSQRRESQSPVSPEREINWSNMERMIDRGRRH
jgi:hypothetical protein